MLLIVNRINNLIVAVLLLAKKKSEVILGGVFGVMQFYMFQLRSKHEKAAREMDVLLGLKHAGFKSYSCKMTNSDHKLTSSLGFCFKKSANMGASTVIASR